ncbi:hypothetical protein ACJX0J_041145, partial [Zea mays]
ITKKGDISKLLKVHKGTRVIEDEQEKGGDIINRKIVRMKSFLGKEAQHPKDIMFEYLNIIEAFTQIQNYVIQCLASCELFYPPLFFDIGLASLGLYFYIICFCLKGT